MKQLPATLKLTLSAIVVTVVLGLPLGVIAAIKRGTWIDTGAMLFSLVGATMPGFWSGSHLTIHSAQAALVSGRRNRGMEVSGDAVPDPGALLDGCGGSTHGTSLLETLSHDYIATARSKGLSERTTIIRHALRNSLLPVVTVMGLQVEYLLGGAVITELCSPGKGLDSLLLVPFNNETDRLLSGSCFLLPSSSSWQISSWTSSTAFLTHAYVMCLRRVNEMASAQDQTHPSPPTVQGSAAIEVNMGWYGEVSSRTLEHWLGERYYC